MQVLVRDNNVEQALRALKKKLQREGVFREMKRAAFYEKPSEKAAREKSEAIRRARKLARKQAIREGLIAAPVKKPNDRRPTRALPSVAPASPKLPQLSAAFANSRQLGPRTADKHVASQESPVA
jgi:small subunit ribosomal protein S21